MAKRTVGAGRETRRIVSALAAGVVAALLIATAAALVTPRWGEPDPTAPPGPAPNEPAPPRDLVGPPAAAAPASRVAVEIDGDEALLRHAKQHDWPGEGTAKAPIRASFEIETTDSTGVRLRGTTLHLVIEAALVTVTGDGDAVQLENVENVRIEHSHLTSGTAGVRIRDAHDVVIANSTIENARYGVLLQGVRGAAVQDSRIALNGIGIYAEPARGQQAENADVEVVGNTLLGNVDPRVEPGGGVVLAGNGHKVAQNILAGNGFAGVWVLGSDTDVSENRFDGGRERAVVVHDGHDVTVRDNRMEGHDEAAVVGHATTRLHIVGNEVRAATAEAFRVGDDHGTRIEGNDIEGSRNGIVAFGSSDLGIKGNEVRLVEQAVDLVEVHGASVEGNVVTDVASGAINLFDAHAVTLEQNRILRSAGHGVFVGKVSSEVALVGNEIRTALRAITVDGASHDVRVTRGIVFGPCITGVDVLQAASVLVERTDVLDCDTGVKMDGGTGHRVEGGVFLRNVAAVSLGPGAGPVHVERITARHNAVGLQVAGSSGHVLSLSDVVENTQGIVFLDAKGIQLAHNWVRDNRIGLHFVNATANLVYDNLIVNDLLPGDQDHVIQNSPQNMWNVTERAGPNVIGGPRIGGNLWGDYDGPDTDADGLGDVPYWPVPVTMPEGNVLGLTVALEGPLDMHPLVTDEDPETGSSPAQGGPEGAPGTEGGASDDDNDPRGVPKAPKLPLRDGGTPVPATDDAVTVPVPGRP